VALVRFAVGPRQLWIAAQLVLALGVAMPLVVEGLPGILLSALLVGSTFTVITLAAMRDAQDIARAQSTRLMAALTAAFAAGQIAGPVFVSLLDYARWSFDRGLLIASLITAAGACALLTRRKES